MSEPPLGRHQPAWRRDLVRCTMRVGEMTMKDENEPISAPAISEETPGPRGGRSPDDNGTSGVEEETSYVPVPPRRSVTVSVRYRVRGRGRPLPYPLPEEEGE